MSIGNHVVSRVLVLGLLTPHLGQAAEAKAQVQAQAQAENWSRLRSMPREERLALWDKLQEFDRLSRAEQSALRALNARIAQLTPEDQATWRAVLRRYHHWVQGLSEDQRNALNAAPASERMKLVTKLRAQERTASNGNTTPLFIQVIDFTAMSPFELGRQLKVWFELTPEQRAEIEQIPTPSERPNRLTELGQHIKVGPMHKITKSEEDTLLAKLDANSQLKGWLTGPLKKADPTKNEKVKRRIAANFYFLEHPPVAVDPSNLMQFEAALPPWYRGHFDHLPPEEARRRLTILYRLVYPAPGEMPTHRKATNPQSPTPSPTAAVPRPPTPSPPPARPGANPF